MAKTPSKTGSTPATATAKPSAAKPATPAKKSAAAAKAVKKPAAPAKVVKKPAASTRANGTAASAATARKPAAPAKPAKAVKTAKKAERKTLLQEASSTISKLAADVLADRIVPTIEQIKTIAESLLSRDGSKDKKPKKKKK